VVKASAVVLGLAMYAVNALIALRLLDSISLSLLGGQAHPQTNNRRAAYNCRWQKLDLNILGGALHRTEGQHTIVDGAQKVFYVLGGERVILSAQGLHTSYDAVSFLSTFSLKCCSLGGETIPQRGVPVVGSFPRPKEQHFKDKGDKKEADTIQDE
jgi:hypothetical protein